MKRNWLLLLTALGEAAMGLLLLAAPTIGLDLLFGSMTSDSEIVARILGVALIAIGVVCWWARRDSGGSSLNGLLIGILTYDVGAAAALAFSGITLHKAGVLLWPAVGLHILLASWCIACLVKNPSMGARP